MWRLIWIFLLGVGLAACASAPEPERNALSASEKEALRPYWEQFVKADPGWDDARGRWLSMSEAAVNTLVENMIRYMSNRFSAHHIGEAQRAARELILLDRLALPYLMALLANDGNAMGLRDMAAGCLEKIGTAAVPGLVEALKAPRWKARRLAVRVLGRIQDGRAVEPLLKVLGEDDSFVVRAEAAVALRRFDQPRVRQALVRTVSDPDAVVAEAAAHSLGRLKCPEAVGPLVDRLEKAERTPEGTLRQTIRAALSRITDLDPAAPYQAFRRWRPDRG